MMSSCVHGISIVKRNANSTIKQQKCKGHEKLDRLLFSKVELSDFPAK